MKSFLGYYYLLFILFLPACQKKVDLSQNESKLSYALGVEAKDVLQSRQANYDLNAYCEGLKDANLDKLKLSKTEIQETLSSAVNSQIPSVAIAAKNVNLAFDYLKKKKAEGFLSTSSQALYKITKQGNGPKPKINDIIEVEFSGRLPDGKEFESTYITGQKREVILKSAMPGWVEVFPLINAGSEFELALPPELAFGVHGGPSVPPNSAVHFEIKFHKIKTR